MMRWVHRLLHREVVESGQTADALDAIDTARRVQDEIDERIAARHHEVAVIRLEQTRIRRELIMNAPLIRKNEDLPGTIGRKP